MMGLKRFSILLLLAIVGLGVGHTPVVITTGGIEGTVTYDGDIPNLWPIDMSADPECARMHGDPVPSPILVLGENNTLGNVFLMVLNPPQGDYASVDKPVVLSHIHCMIEPRVLALQTHQTILFTNYDGLPHSFHGKPDVNKEFTAGTSDKVKEIAFQWKVAEPLPILVKCDDHPWERAYVAVVDHPYFAVTSADGKFSIPNLPDGEYEVLAWHERLSTQKAKVVVAGGTAALNFIYEGPKK